MSLLETVSAAVVNPSPSPAILLHVALALLVESHRVSCYLYDLVRGGYAIKYTPCLLSVALRCYPIKPLQPVSQTDLTSLSWSNGRHSTNLIRPQANQAAPYRPPNTDPPPKPTLEPSELASHSIPHTKGEALKQAVKAVLRVLPFGKTQTLDLVELKKVHMKLEIVELVDVAAKLLSELLCPLAYARRGDSSLFTNMICT